MELQSINPVTPNTPPPTSPTQLSKQLPHALLAPIDPAVPPSKEHYAAIDPRLVHLEILRDQLKAAQIPVTKRGSLSESAVPASAEDCSFYPGTTRCKLDLCEDTCTIAHAHHRTHARPVGKDRPLIYSRPSVSLLPTAVDQTGSGVVSTYASRSGSPDPSLPASPQQYPRRPSSLAGFGFNFGPRSSVTSVNTSFLGGTSGIVTPADFASGPPSPLSSGSSGLRSQPTSAPTSPRLPTHHTVASSGSNFTDICQPIAEEKEATASSTIPASSSAAAYHTPLAPSTTSELVPPNPETLLETDYWKLNNHIVNLHDYRPEVTGVRTVESLTRQDLAPAPREDCPDQEHVWFDPRSPQPPSPVEILHAQVIRVNMNQSDQTQPELQFELKPTTQL